MKEYYRIMLGKASSLAEECYNQGYIGGDWEMNFNLENNNSTSNLPENLKDFNYLYKEKYFEVNPHAKKMTAALAMGMLFTIVKKINQGDIILSPDGHGKYYVGEVTSGYYYEENVGLPHRRSVKWHNITIDRTEISEPFRNSAGSIGTVSNITKHSVEIDNFISGRNSSPLISNDETIEDPSIFALEKHLEDFLITNWNNTELSEKYEIYVDGDAIGQQFPTDTGPIDILAISKDKKEILVIELKKGRASDSVIGQIQRYMGFVKDELAERDQKVRGLIIAFEKDIRLERALSVTQNIEFYVYKVQFDLKKIL